MRLKLTVDAYEPLARHWIVSAGAELTLSCQLSVDDATVVHACDGGLCGYDGYAACAELVNDKTAMSDARMARPWRASCMARWSPVLGCRSARRPLVGRRVM